MNFNINRFVISIFIFFSANYSIANELGQNQEWQFQSGMYLESIDAKAKKETLTEEKNVFSNLLEQCELKNGNSLIDCNKQTTKLSAGTKIILTGKRPRVCINRNNNLYYANQSTIFKTYDGYYDIYGKASCFLDLNAREISYVDKNGEIK